MIGRSILNSTNVLTAVAVAIFAGCMSGCADRPARVEVPDWDPEEMADQAIADLDRDGDGKLSPDELAAAPGLAYCARLLDTDGDGSLSREEVLARITNYVEMKVGLNPFTCTVVLDRRPLVGAKVRLVPESFLGEIVEPLESTSKTGGRVDFLAEGIKMSVVPVGMYRVEITSPDAQIPAKYNTETTLGVEVSGTDDPYHPGPVVFELRSK